MIILNLESPCCSCQEGSTLSLSLYRANGKWHEGRVARLPTRSCTGVQNDLFRRSLYFMRRRAMLNPGLIGKAAHAIVLTAATILACQGAIARARADLLFPKPEIEAGDVRGGMPVAQ